MRNPLLAIACSAAVSSVGQITLDATSAMPLRAVLSLTAGPKLMDYLNPYSGAVNIYNLDLTIHRTLIIPDPPPGCIWGIPSYITEALFDTDATTIEYMITAYSCGSYFAIHREDGTALLTKSPGTTLTGLGADEFDSWPSIFQTPDGPKLVLLDSFDGPTEIYSLPGEVPCVSACFPGAQEGFGMEVGEMERSSGGLSVQNPAIGTVLVTVRLPDGADQGQLTVVDAAGRVALTMPSVKTGTLSLDTSRLAAGSYLLHVQTDRGTVRAVPMTVVH